jgi:hypothetical protein
VKRRRKKRHGCKTYEAFTWVGKAKLGIKHYGFCWVKEWKYGIFWKAKD